MLLLLCYLTASKFLYADFYCIYLLEESKADWLQVSGHQQEVLAGSCYKWYFVYLNQVFYQEMMLSL